MRSRRPSAGRAPRLASPPEQNTAQQRIVLYDEDCGFCKWSLNKILAWDRSGTVRPLAIQSEEGQALLAAAGIPDAARLETWHVALPGGEVRSGGAAAAPLVADLPAGEPLAALFRTFPKITDRTYRLVAGNRDWFARRLGIDASCELRR